jgi:Zn-dependent protease
MMQRMINPWTIGLIAILGYFAIRDGAMNDPMAWLMNIVIMLPGIVIGLSFHEYAHALVAYKLGDDTPKLQGRVTINPLAHIDPIGFLAILLIRFGWGKPVEIYPGNFKNRRRDSILVSLAGVMMNLFIAIFFTLVLKLMVTVIDFNFFITGMGNSIFMMVYYIIFINLMLMVFNLLPVPPLDGFSILTEVFDLRKSEFYYWISNRGFLILMVLIVFNITGLVLTPAIGFFMELVDAVIYL